MFPNTIINKTHSTMSYKQKYETPESELLVCDIERRFMVDSPEPSLNGSGFGDSKGNVTEPDSGIWNWME